MSRRVIRAIFVAVLLLFPLQLVFVRKFGEPYPALMMPAFRATQVVQEGNFTTRTAEIVVTFADGGAETITPATLLARAPSSHYGALLRHFRPADEPTAAPAERTTVATGGARGWLVAAIPGLAIRARRRGEVETDPRTRRWLGQRLHELYPARAAVRTEFVWFDEVYHFEPRFAREREPYGTFIVALDHD